MKYDLFNNPSGDHIVAFVALVAAQAVDDHKRGHGRRSGQELADMFTSECRKGHERMATGIYNNVRWTLDTNWRK